jgi:hypothetical protein
MSIPLSPSIVAPPATATSRETAEPHFSIRLAVRRELHRLGLVQRVELTRHPLTPFQHYQEDLCATYSAD